MLVSFKPLVWVNLDKVEEVSIIPREGSAPTSLVFKMTSGKYNDFDLDRVSNHLNIPIEGLAAALVQSLTTLFNDSTCEESRNLVEPDGSFSWEWSRKYYAISASHKKR